MYCRITLSSGAVQYLWSVYATFASKGLPKTEKYCPTARLQEREYGGHPPFVSRPPPSCRPVPAKNSAPPAWENAGSAHSASHNRALLAHRDSGPPAAARWLPGAPALVDSDRARDIRSCHRCSCPFVRPVRHADQESHTDLQHGSRRSTGPA